MCVDSFNCTYVLATCISSLTFLIQRKKINNIIFAQLQNASRKKRPTQCKKSPFAKWIKAAS